MLGSRKAVALSAVMMLTACPPSSNKPSIIIRATAGTDNTTICVKGSGFTQNGPIRVTMLMPPYTLNNGQPGPNPLANQPFGNTTAQSDGSYRATFNLSGRQEAICSVAASQSGPSQPILFVVDQTTSATAASALPPGFMCGFQQAQPPPPPPPPSPIPVPSPFGDPTACQ